MAVSIIKLAGTVRMPLASTDCSRTRPDMLPARSARQVAATLLAR